MQKQRPFHFAFKIDDLATTRKLYGEILDSTKGRSAEKWVDFIFVTTQP